MTALNCGDKFYNFLDVQYAINSFSEASCSKYCVQYSRKVASVKHKYQFHINEDLVYYEIKYVCVYFGIYKSTSKGLRRVPRSIKTNCPAYICLRVASCGRYLEVKSCDHNHNHELSPELCDAVAHRKALYTKVREESKRIKASIREQKIASKRLRNSQLIATNKKAAEVIPAGQKMVCVLRTLRTIDDNLSECSAQLIDRSSHAGEYPETDISNSENQTILDETIVDVDDDFFKLVKDIDITKMKETNQQLCVEDTSITETEMTVISEEERSTLGIETSLEPDHSKRLDCRVCGKSFQFWHIRRRHEKFQHGIGAKEGELHLPKFNYTQCVECCINFRLLKELREHLVTKHNLKVSEENHVFANMQAFYQWKKEMEAKTFSYYTMKQPRKSAKKLVHVFGCNRSGKKVSRASEIRKHKVRTQGSCKMGINCISGILAAEYPDKVVVKYTPEHYGHGSLASLFELTQMEHKAIKESLSQGIEYEDILEDFTNTSCTKDYFQMNIAKIRDRKFISEAFKRDMIYNWMGEFDSLNNWISECSNLPENSPVLYSKLDNSQSKFLLIIMSEFQKYVLINASKLLVCIDTHIRNSGGEIHINILYVAEENDNVFPVAFCISNKTNKKVLHEFFSTIKHTVGRLSFKCFMSLSVSKYYDAWCKVMEDSPRWLLNQWDVDNKIRRIMQRKRILQGKDARKRSEVFQTLRNLMSCQNVDVFNKMFETYVDSLKRSPSTLKLGLYVSKKLASTTESWAYCHRKDISTVVNTHLEVMHQIFFFCKLTARGQRMDKCIFVLMMLVKRKIVEKLLASHDSDSLYLAECFIKNFHQLGLSIPTRCLTPLNQKTWLIISEEEETSYVTRELMSCPEACALKCVDCDVCIHMFSCSCLQNLINAHLCQHIHAVVWHFLMPDFVKNERLVLHGLGGEPEKQLPSGTESHENFIDRTQSFWTGPDSSENTHIPSKSNNPVDKTIDQLNGLYKLFIDRKLRLNEKDYITLIKKLRECTNVCNSDTKLFQDVGVNTSKQLPAISVFTFGSKENSKR